MNVVLPFSTDVVRVRTSSCHSHRNRFSLNHRNQRVRSSGKVKKSSFSSACVALENITTMHLAWIKLHRL